MILILYQKEWRMGISFRLTLMSCRIRSLVCITNFAVDKGNIGTVVSQNVECSGHKFVDVTHMAVGRMDQLRNYPEKA
jgi:hypothetical protein